MRDRKGSKVIEMMFLSSITLENSKTYKLHIYKITRVKVAIYEQGGNYYKLIIPMSMYVEQSQMEVLNLPIDFRQVMTFLGLNFLTCSVRPGLNNL